MRSKLSTRYLIQGGTGALVLFATVSSWIGIRAPWVVLNENQILYLFSTSAQVIAAIYGLTLTGFLFFRTELTREAIEDETLIEPVEALKARYFEQLVFITLLVGLTLLLANLAIALESSNRNWWYTALFINSGQVAFGVSFVVIALFVFDVVAPQRIERASQNLQNQLDPTRGPEARGSLEAFLQNYNRIESLLIEAGYPYRSSAQASPEARPPKRLSNTRLADILLGGEVISPSLYKQLRQLITLRNAIIHGAEPIVSAEIVSHSALVLRDLETALDKGAHRPA